MPSRPPRPCSAPGCRALTDQGYCPAHRKQPDQRRGSARARGYTAQWDIAAAAFKRAHPLCLGCTSIGRVAATAVVDHVEPHRGDPMKFWDTDNWQPACKWHHDAVKAQLEILFDAGKITAADLWLSSRTASALTKKMQG